MDDELVFIDQVEFREGHREGHASDEQPPPGGLLELLNGLGQVSSNELGRSPAAKPPSATC